MALDFSSVNAQYEAEIMAWRQAVADRDVMLSDLRQEIEFLKNPPKPRFPGDIGLGRIRLGAVTATFARHIEHEVTSGRMLGRRTYYRPQDGINPILPGGLARTRILEDQKAGRESHISLKPGLFRETAIGRFDLELQAFARWTETALAFPIKLTVNHEPENDGQSPVDFCAAQARVRKAIGSPSKLSFGGSLMTYSWDPASGRNPDEWFPGPDVWEWTAGDHYAEKAGTSLLSSKWDGFLASCRKWGTVPAVAELGIRAADPDASGRLLDFYEDCIDNGVAFIYYYDSAVNSSGLGWVLEGPGHDRWHGLMRDPRSV